MKDINLSKKEIINLLLSENQEEIDKLFQLANQLAENLFGNKVFFRGLLEFSNICSKDCFYCGLRKSNKNLSRFLITEEEILSAAIWADQNGYGSITLQSGEINTASRLDLIKSIISQIKKHTKLGITLSLGELCKKTYQDLFELGAHRYLLRIETSSSSLYKKVHPKDHSFENRLQCLKDLQDIGYQTGTGVMIGLPFQTIKDLANDLLFFQKFDIDMIGMGPYLCHEDTPLAKTASSFSKDKRFTLSLKMIALARVLLKDVNIAAATALQVLDAKGREKALQCGANVLMPIITPKKYRDHYMIYEDKPCTDETASQCQMCLKRRLKSAKKEIAYNEWGDPPHFFARTKKIKIGL